MYEPLSEIFGMKGASTTLHDAEHYEENYSRLSDYVVCKARTRKKKALNLN